MSFANGEIAQLARAFGSYPKGREFESPSRYQYEFIIDRNIYFFVIFIVIILKIFLQMSHLICFGKFKIMD